MGPRGPRVWIAEILFRADVAAKIRSKHHLSPAEIREAACFGAHRDARWHVHPTYGRRLLVVGETYEGKRIIVYLKPLNEAEGIWEGRTARRINR
jgi:hypothetical protein